ncbi:MAG: hypothetical protein DWQ31_07915 [Planctomycetota bacterium]|nr:MAG: hypothetical protein DWQ31_07915 [Planctomycetota bacterium]REJ96118.1 MAG: hypothetical protein DWQ35_05265 [Planctomycetota bacterium]REK21890.1 MAG: hypothetical protein DWQ42_18595 [Planctomycetota bacterium]REK46698.1 MAG: hypothetical protein DWQ46_06280 [Planctomycetota bacterium]
MLPIVTLALLTLSGCNFDPATTVNIEVSGVTASEQSERITEALKGMTDGGGHKMTSSRSGEVLSVRLSPVSDVEAFSKKINFGEVTEVVDRTVKVKYVP